MPRENNLTVWAEALEKSFNEVLTGVIGVLPNLIVAIVVVIFGWLLGLVLSKFIYQLVRSIKLDKALSSAGLNELLQKAGFELNSGKFLGELVKWFTIVVFLITAFDILKLREVTSFLREVVVSYIPEVIAAVLILLIAVVIAEALRKFVVASAKAADLQSANFLGSITKWAIWIFAVLAALFQLGIGAIFIQTLFTGVVVALSIAFGLSFGLGGRDAAASFLDKVRKEMSDKE
ncbi:MAG TPA: hypothetical protein PJ997_02205 [Candidatus Paceibacterota bacterium]|nr:hypothetical protein [Candidatus Paceibacterota bacterium]HMP19128.1 hypothetical protein [Candidatus Paceibacterota bacterium]HMP85605.1 hypothetical protein [Candidatus Paceibacterota bacterium]